MRFIFLLFLWPITMAYAFNCHVVDDLGRDVILHRPAQRIISLAPDLTEDLFAIGAGKQISGVIFGSDYPEEAKQLPVVAYYNSLDIEKIIVLKPDLILVWAEGNMAHALQKLNLPIYFSRPKHLLDIPKTLKNLACLTGTTNTSKKIIDDYIEKYNSLKYRYEKKKPVTVFFQMWSPPLMTVGGTSWINEILNLCQAKNIFAAIQKSAPIIDIESVLTARPQLIIQAGGNVNWQKMISKTQPFKLWVLTPSLIERPGPRLMLGAEQLCQHIETARAQLPVL